MRTELTGPQQASDPRGMPLHEFVAEVMALLEAQDHPEGEILVERSRIERWAERNGRYGAVYGVVNPA